MNEVQRMFTDGARLWTVRKPQGGIPTAPEKALCRLTDVTRIRKSTIAARRVSFAYRHTVIWRDQQVWSRSHMPDSEANGGNPEPR